MTLTEKRETMQSPKSDLNESIRRVRILRRWFWCLAFVVGVGSVLGFIAVRLYMYWKWHI